MFSICMKRSLGIAKFLYRSDCDSHVARVIQPLMTSAQLRSREHTMVESTPHTLGWCTISVGPRSLAKYPKRINKQRAMCVPQVLFGQTRFKSMRPAGILAMGRFLMTEAKLNVDDKVLGAPHANTSDSELRLIFTQPSVKVGSLSWIYEVCICFVR